MIIDILAAIPFDLLGEFFNLNSRALKFFGLLKLIRILRLSRIITYLNFKDDVEITLRYAKIVFFLSIYIHCYTCFWFYIVNLNDQWLPPGDFDKGNTTLYTEVWYEQYFDCLYQATLIFVGKDIYGVTDYQLAILAVSYTMSQIIIAFIFADISVVLSGENRK